MKTIYTDNYGVYPWAMLAVALYMFWSAYEGFASDDGNRLGLGIGAGALFLILALRRVWDRRNARVEGRDPSIVRVEKND
ncbi:hypothetical protein GCM10009127_01860 [Alteraurantiacibacter aestuarii]|uniref:Uncharacterized protein n=1 Tax=Alteraurantiacibacter aestuarii TaxID=650004 RepID=A0A844ZNF9_9SPHN|nr:hypothetical protein [Alteraurantiacibacter aestuarii]MXO88560.1 hypothetical protein [Alteraurantiacibacter aestuarii]